jgi:hypothetical protein
MAIKIDWNRLRDFTTAADTAAGKRRVRCDAAFVIDIAADTADPPRDSLTQLGHSCEYEVVFTLSTNTDPTIRATENRQALRQELRKKARQYRDAWLAQNRPAVVVLPDGITESDSSTGAD